MAEDFLIVEKQDRVGTIVINRPERRNALSPLMLFKMAELLAELQKGDEIRCVVIRGAGDKAFSAGYDISDLPVDLTPEMAEEFRTKNPLRTALKAVINFPYPVIAMINGHAIGAGCELAMTCDIRVAAEGAKLSMPPAKLGIVYHWAGVFQFINTAGLANAKEMFFTGRAYEANRAKEMGLVNYVVPPDKLASFTYELAKEISENAPLSLKGLKTIFNKYLFNQKVSAEDAREMEDLVDQAFHSEDLKEGQKAFQEKRKPVFKGR